MKNKIIAGTNPEFIRGLISPYLLNMDTMTEGIYDMPKAKAYNSELPDEFIQLTDASRISDSSMGLHCYMPDSRINPTWSHPSNYLQRVKSHCCVIAPDYSMFVDAWRPVNIWNVFRNRLITCYWQQAGANVIPSASFGDADSLAFEFDGLPEDSTIAIGHVAVGKSKSQKRLYQVSVERLIEEKRPRLLLVYGAPLDFAVGVPVRVYESRIQKLRRL